MIDFEQGVWLYCSALAAAVPVMLPVLQFGLIYKIWDKYNKKVDRNYCRNTCWDTVFKGEWSELRARWPSKVFIGPRVKRVGRGIRKTHS